MPKGVFLVLEGGDGAGKTTQIGMLDDYFQKTGRRTRRIHFPRLNAGPYGEMIAAYLRGEYGGLEAVHPKLAALLYALDRREAAPELRSAVADGEIVLADRYLFSNIAYQGARLDNPEEREEMAGWIENLEYRRHAIPRPDLVIYLDAPREFSRVRLSSPRTGADRAYLRGGADLHEADDSLQDKVRREFLAFREKRPDELAVVDCREAGGGMAARTVVHARILAVLRRFGLD
ncbi:MAG: dTMP kinase [Planctomycetota bacterium]|jgi:dTMP kinase|nr:dTMP kinase [Planctomycetota bacterium]